MIQRNTTSGRAYFQSILIAGLCAGSALGQLPTVPSLNYEPSLEKNNRACSQVDSSSRTKHLVDWIGLNRRRPDTGSVALQSLPEVPLHLRKPVKQIAHESLSQTVDTGFVQHAYAPTVAGTTNEVVIAAQPLQPVSPADEPAFITSAQLPILPLETVRPLGASTVANAPEEEESLLDLALPSEVSVGNYHLRDDDTVEPVATFEPAKVQIHESFAPQQPVASTDERPASFSSSSHRPLSLRISGSNDRVQLQPELFSAQPATSFAAPIQAAPIQPAQTTRPARMLAARNNEAYTASAIPNEPVVRAVKQVANDPSEFDGTAAYRNHYSESVFEPIGGANVATELNVLIKRKFPSSRVEVRDHDDGLMVSGIAASEAEAAKILAMVRKAALCPVSDRVITKR